MIRKNNKGITLISLVVTIIVLIILASVSISLIFTQNNGLIGNAKEATNKTKEQMATEKINLKITNSQMNSYAVLQRMPTLQELANDFCEDSEIQYVTLESKKIAGLEKIDVGEATSIFTKLKEYPYEFEINSSLQLASVDGVKIASNKESGSWKLWKKGIGHISEETAIQLPENFNELLIDVELPETEINEETGLEISSAYSYSWVIIKDMLKDNYKTYTSGAGWGDYIIIATLYINKDNVFIEYFNQFNDDITNKIELSIYYR